MTKINKLSNGGELREYVDGDKYWYQNGELHRVDGPAIEYIDGHKEWWIKGVQITEEEFNARGFVDY